MSSDRSTQRAALIAATLAAFLTPFMTSALNLAMPEIGHTLSMSAVLLGWVPTVYMLATAVFLVPFGRLADLYGRKRVFAYGIGVYMAGSLFSGVAPSAALLLAARVVQGLGSAMIFGTGIAILTSAFPLDKRGRVLGINVAATYIGLSVGPFIGGLMTQYLGWRSVFLVNVPLGLVVLAFVLFQLKGEWAEARGEKFDLAGALIYAVALVALMYGFSALPAARGAGLIAAGLAGLAAFAWWERRTQYPVFEVELLFQNHTFAFSSLAALINYGATSAVAFLVSLYLQYIKALTPEQAGFVLIAQPILQALISPAAGRLSDRVEPRIVASAGMALTAAGLLLLVFVGPATPLWGIVARLALLGIGFGLFSSPNMNAIMSSVGRRFYGVASGTAATMRLLGQMTSMGIALLLFAIHIGRVEITPVAYPQFLTSMKTAFVVFSSLCAGGILASLTRGKIREGNGADRRQAQGAQQPHH